MNAQEFTFDALLKYSKLHHSDSEIEQLLEFIKDFTLEINDIDLSSIAYGGTLLN